MDDLVQWLRAQLDEDERIARAAAEEDGPDWRYDGHAVLTCREDDLVAVASQDFMGVERGTHIAEHDPARVLREIDPKRLIIREWEDAERAAEQDPTDASARVAVLAFGIVLKLTAAVYADRPGYREEWRP